MLWLWIFLGCLVFAIVALRFGKSSRPGFDDRELRDTGPADTEPYRKT